MCIALLVLENNIYSSSKTIEISSEYMNQLSNYVVSGSSISVQEAAGQGLL